MTAHTTPERGRDFSPPTTKTLARCDDEPIHLPGAVQPHGRLFEVEGEPLHILCASSNLRAVLGIGTGEALGKPLQDVLEEAAAQ